MYIRMYVCMYMYKGETRIMLEGKMLLQTVATVIPFVKS
jgi:hypothetical protein